MEPSGVVACCQSSRGASRGAQRPEPSISRSSSERNLVARVTKGQSLSPSAILVRKGTVGLAERAASCARSSKVGPGLARTDRSSLGFQPGGRSHLHNATQYESSPGVGALAGDTAAPGSTAQSRARQKQHGRAHPGRESMAESS